MADFTFPSDANLCRYFLTQRLDEGLADKPAVLVGNQRWTYADLDGLAARVATALRAHGVRREDRVLIMLRDGIEFAAAFFGVLRMGAVVTMVNPDIRPEDVGHYVAYTRARVVFADASVVAALDAVPRTEEFPAVIVAGGAAGPFSSWEAEVPTRAADNKPVPVHVDDPAIWLFTSGSTGISKAVVHRAGDYIFNTEVFARGTIGYRRDDVTVSVSKLFFGYATGTNLMFPLAHGATAALFPERSTPEAVLAACTRHGATVLTGVPTFMAGALALAEKDASVLDGLKKVRFMFSAGEALPAELYEKWKARTGVEVLDGIGSAEMFHIYITNRLGDVRAGSLGRIVDGYEARIVDDDGRDVPDGEIGTMHIKGKSVGLCYWQDREKSYATFRGEWCATQDKFSRDAKGYYTFHGRADDLLKVGGRWVAPLEVENALLGHSAIEACCVTGMRDADGLEKPLAWVQVKSGIKADAALADSIKAWAKDRVEPYKYPREVRFMDALPRNDRGKVDRKALRART